jgi:antitoxin YefM
MTIEISYTQARANLAKLMDQVNDDREIVIIKRRNGEDAALIAASELSSILETLHLLRSPKNAERLLSALESAKRGEGRTMTIDELRHEVGLDDEA